MFVRRREEKYICSTRAYEIPCPERTTIGHISKACRIIGKSPVELIVEEVAKPPLAAFGVVEEQFAAPRTCKRADLSYYLL